MKRILSLLICLCLIFNVVLLTACNGARTVECNCKCNENGGTNGNGEGNGSQNGSNQNGNTDGNGSGNGGVIEGPLVDIKPDGFESDQSTKLDGINDPEKYSSFDLPREKLEAALE